MFKSSFQQALLLILSYCFISLAHAQTPETISPFSPNKWSKSVDSIEAKIASTPWTSDRISYTLAVLTDLQRNAKECIRYSQAELDKINLASTQSALGSTSQAQQLAATTLTSKEVELNALRADCRLFLFRAQDVFTEVEKLQQHLIANEIFSKGPSIFENLKNIPLLHTALAAVSLPVLFQELGLEYLTTVNVGSLLCFLIVIGFVLGLALQAYGKRRALFLKKSSWHYTAQLTFNAYVYPLSFSAIFALFFVGLTFRTGLIFTASLSIYVFAYLLMLAAIRGIFYPPKDARPVIALPQADSL